MSKKLRVALVGCGIISANHIKAYQSIPDRAEVTICCDIDIEKAKSRAELAGGVVATADFDSILTNDDIDAIDLCTPPHLHCDAVIAAMKAGKHVMCQKPLARTLPECRLMIDVAKQSGKVLFYAEMNRVNPGAVAARKAVESGKIGQVVGLQSTFAYWQGGEYMTTSWRYDPKVAGGGQLLDSAIHALALMRDIGGEIASVSCFTTNFRPELGGDDTSSLMLRYKAGHLGAMYSTQATARWYPNANFAVFGTDGIITLGGNPYDALFYTRDQQAPPESILGERRNMFEAMISDFVDAALDGKPITATAESGYEDLKLVLAAYESDRSGCSVDLDTSSV